MNVYSSIKLAARFSKKRRKPFLLIACGKGQRNIATLTLKPGGKRQLLCGSDTILCKSKCPGRMPRYQPGDFNGPRFACAIINHFPDQPQLQRLFRTDSFTGQDHFHGGIFAHEPDQPLCCSVPRNMPQLDFGLAKPGVSGGYRHIAKHHQFMAASDTKTRDRSNNRDTGAFQHGPIFSALAILNGGNSVGTHFCDISPC